MVLSADLVRQAQALLEGAKVIRCICHKNPDGDAIGSLLGIGLLLEQAYPQKTVTLHCKDPVPDMFQVLPGASRVLGAPVLQPGDAAVILDSAEPKLTDFHVSHTQLFDKSMPVLVLDHHPGNPNFGTVNIIEPQSASTCEIIVSLADALGWSISTDVATALLTGVYTDTGGLLHSNTSAGVYRTTARLLRAGARHQLIVTAVFRTAKLSTLKLWGRVLEKITLTEEGGAVSAVTEGDFRATGADGSELAGAIDYVNAVPGMRFSMVLSERDGKVKGSLRTLRDDVDVAAMAGKFQGGGHKKAAGFAVTGKLKPEMRWKVVDPTGTPVSVTPSAPQAEPASPGAPSPQLSAAAAVPRQQPSRPPAA